MTALTRRLYAILLVPVALVLGVDAPVPQEDWQDAVCEVIGCFNDTELHCANAKGKRQVVITIFWFEIVIDEVEYEIECTQGWP